MIQATIKTTGWKADTPKITYINIDENDVAFEQVNNDGSRIPILFGECYNVYKMRTQYVKENAGYASTTINAETFEKHFYAKYLNRGILDRLIGISYKIV